MSSAIPFADLRPVVGLVARNTIADVAETLSRCDFINSEAVETFEKKLAKYLDVPHVVACANGTDALIMALRMRGIGPGKRVAIPNLTFWATYEAVVTVGAEAVLIDADPLDMQMSFDRLEEAHTTERPLHAVILAHLFGWASEVTDKFRLFCDRKQIPLIEDAAQAIGVRYKDEPLLKYASIAALSFHPTKVLGGIMDGGAIVVSSKDNARQLRGLRNHGRDPLYPDQYVWARSANSRMSTINAAYLSRLLDHLDEIIENRRETWRRYMSAAGNDLDAHTPPRSVQGNGYLLVARADRPEHVARRLTESGVGHARFYSCTIADQTGYHGSERGKPFEVSRNFCQHVINLPLYYRIPHSHVDRAVEVFRKAVR